MTHPEPDPAVPGGGPVHRGLRQASHRLSPRALALTTLGVGLAVVGLCTAGAGEVYDQVSDGDGLAALDHPVLRAVVADRTPWLTDLARALAMIGGTVGMPLLAAAVTALLAWRRRSWEPVLLLLVTAAGSVLLTVAGKGHVERARPPHVDAVPPFETSFSFPSGHSLNSMALAAVVAYLLLLRRERTAGRVLVVLLAGAFAVLMGLSRVYLGAHWLTDVLVAWALALAWVAVVVTAHRWYVVTARARRARAGRARLGASTP